MDSKNDKIDSEYIGKMIADVRKSVGLSQVELARKLGLDKRTVSAYEKGICRIHAARLVEIAEILDFSLDSLTGKDLSKIDGRTRSAHAIKELDKLPEEDRKFVFGMIDKLAAAASK